MPRAGKGGETVDDNSVADSGLTAVVIAGPSLGPSGKVSQMGGHLHAASRDVDTIGNRLDRTWTLSSLQPAHHLAPRVIITCQNAHALGCPRQGQGV